MAHYAFLDSNNIVVQVIEGKSEPIEGKEARQWYEDFMGKKCVETFPFREKRFNYAGVGYLYREDLDAFIRPQCHPEAVLNEDTCNWVCDNTDHNVEVPE